MHACKEETSNLCSWCSNNRWVGPETERIPQPVPDPNNRGHFMDVFQTESTGRTPDDYLPRKCLRDLHEELFCQCHKRWRLHQELLFKIQCWCEACYYIILIALKILIWEKTLEQLKLRNERGKRRNGHTRISLRRTSLYRIGLVGLPLFKCDEIHLRWGFTVKTTVILLKNVFEIIGLDQLWTGCTGRSSRGKVFIIYFHRFSQCVPGGLVEKLWPGPLNWPPWLRAVFSIFFFSSSFLLFLFL